MTPLPSNLLFCRFSRFPRFSRFSRLLPFLFLAACSPAPQPEAPAPAPLLPDEPARLSVSLSTNVIRIGDPVEVTLTALHRPGTALELPPLASGNDILVRSQTAPVSSPVSAPAPDGRSSTGQPPAPLEQTTARWTLTSLVVSNHVLAPDAPVLLHLPDGSTVTQSFPFASLQVVTTLAPDESDPRPLDLDLARWPAPPSRLLRNLLFAFLALLALAAAAVYALRRLAATSSVFRPSAPPPPPPHVAALSALDDLAARNLPAQGLCDPFYVALSSIVRAYLEARFALNAPDQTTEEFIRSSLRAAALSPAHRRLLADFLEQADLVKFARAVPTLPEMDAAFSSARSFVLQTAPAPAAPDCRPSAGQSSPPNPGVAP